MNDEHETEARLRDAFHRESLPEAPASLFAALEAVPNAPVTRRRDGRGTGAGRRPWSLLAVAAVLVVGGAVAVSIGGRGPSPTPPATVAPSPVASQPAEASVGTATLLKYEPQWTAGAPFDVEVLTAVVEIVQQRIDAAGLVGVRVATDPDARILVDAPAGTDLDLLRSLVGSAGHLAFVPLGTTSMEAGDHVDLVSLPPLFDGSSVVQASIVDDQNGQPAMNLKLREPATSLFAAYTEGHIGEYFAIVLDGTVVTAPVIQIGIASGDVQISFGGSDPAKLEHFTVLATFISFGPLPVGLAEVTDEPNSSYCEGPLPVAGPQLTCDQAVQSALTVLPPEHPTIAEITFNHGCNDVAGKPVLDCAAQLSGLVKVTFVDGSPPVWVAVGIGTDPTIISPQSPDPSGSPIALNVGLGDIGCDSIGVHYRSLVIHIDPSVVDPVWAISDTGDRLQIFWSPAFRAGTSFDPVVYDARGIVVAREGTTIEIAEGAWPNLAGYFVCPSPDALYVFSVPPPA